MRTYNYYYVRKKVYGYPAEGQEISTRAYVYIFFGIRVQSLFLSNGDIYKSCNFFLQKEIEDLTPPDEATISSLIISNTNDIQRLGLVNELSFSIVPVDPAKQLNPYNAHYNTSIPYSTELSYQTIVPILLNWRINFVYNDDTFVYKIEQNSIKEKRQKKTAPILG